MAGGGGDIAPSSSKRGKKHKTRRSGIRMDMTPMVDVAFLLLTFFMLTSVFSKPQAMEINLPPSDVKVEVAATKLLTVRVMENQKIFWNKGDVKENPIQVMDFKDIGNILKQEIAAEPMLITLVKVDRKGKYFQMVDVMDELQLAAINRFSLAALTDDDIIQVLKIDPAATTSVPSGNPPK